MCAEGQLSLKLSSYMVELRRQATPQSLNQFPQSSSSVVDVLPCRQSSHREEESQNSNRNRGELTGPNSALPLITGARGGRKHPQDTAVVQDRLWEGVTVGGEMFETCAHG